MGIIRTLLAIAVVADHTDGFFGFRLITGQGAVQSFYVISGFYMSLVLQRKYAPDWQGTRLFYQNRYLRLAPTYWVILALSLTVMFTVGPVPAEYGILKRMSIPAIAFIVGTNLVIFGQDVVMFMAVRPGSNTLYFTPKFIAQPLPLYRFLVVPQAWTLGLELAFYVVAPFLLRRSFALILAIMAASFGVRLYLMHLGFDHDPWTYRFFPTELFFFLAGSVAYRGYERIKRVAIPQAVSIAALLLVVALIFTFSLFKFDLFARHMGFYAVFIAALPLVFRLTKDSRWDNRIGELSYPIYISHMLVLRHATWAGRAWSFATVGMSVLLAMVVVHFVERPIDAWRQRRAAASAA